MHEATRQGKIKFAEEANKRMEVDTDTFPQMTGMVSVAFKNRLSPGILYLQCRKEVQQWYFLDGIEEPKRVGSQGRYAQPAGIPPQWKYDRRFTRHIPDTPPSHARVTRTRKYGHQHPLEYDNRRMEGQSSRTTIAKEPKI